MGSAWLLGLGVAGVAGAVAAPAGLVALGVSMHACATVQASAAADAGFDGRLADRPTLVVFMTDWCEVCRHETPALTRWARAHRDGERPAGVLVVMSGSRAEDVPRLAREHQLDQALLPVVADPDGAIADRFGVTATPTMILFAGAATRPSPMYRSVGELPEPPALAASPALTPHGP